MAKTARQREAARALVAELQAQLRLYRHLREELHAAPGCEEGMDRLKDAVRAVLTTELADQRALVAEAVELLEGTEACVCDMCQKEDPESVARTRRLEAWLARARGAGQ